MKFGKVLFVAAAAVIALASCKKEDPFGAPKVELTDSAIEVPAAGADEKVSFVATRDWKVTGIPEWIEVSPSEGTPSLSKQEVTITVQPTLDARTATIKIEIEGISASVDIKQAGVEPKISISPNGSVDVSAEGDRVTVVVFASRDWTLSGLPEWITANVDKGLGGMFIDESTSLTIAANEGDARTATITFTCVDQKAELTISQEAAPKGIDVAGTEWRMDYGFIDPDMEGYFTGIRFTDETNFILAEGDPEDGFWEDYPTAEGTYEVNEDGTIVLSFVDEDGEEGQLNAFFIDGLLYLDMYYDAYYEEYGNACGFVQYLGE